MFLSYYVFKGFFWMIVANGSVMVNDIMAYVFGKLFGRHSLIKLSPNKTWEGFIGGGVSTVLFAVVVSAIEFHWISEYSLHFLLFTFYLFIFTQISGYISQIQYVVCPVKKISFEPF